VEEQVRAALDRGDLAAARDIIHPIRGLVGMLGMTQVFKAAEALETSLKAQDREASEAAQAQFAEGLRRFRTSMEALYPRA
jgi:HPt (histidine-containing phosphotransfer) domain-containing protein